MNSIALAYEPVWDRLRRICASRLTIEAVDPTAVALPELLASLTEAWPPDAPPLLLSTTSPPLLVSLLRQAPVRNTWLEVPEFIWAKPEALELLLKARRLGHQLLWRGELSRFAPYAKRYQGLRGVLEVSANDALMALQAAAQGGEFSLPANVQRLENPIVAGHLYRGVSSQALANHCLDKSQAWGLVGWPDEELLLTHGRQPVPMDQRVLTQVMQAADAEAPIQQIEMLLQQDPVVTYKLLRVVNSAAFGLSHEVESLRHALMMLGYDKLKGWLRDGLATASADKSYHPLRHAMLMRSRLMRLLIEPNSDQELKGEVQLTGVLAQIDRLLRQPMAELLNPIPISSRVYSSLVRNDGPYVAYLDVARAMADPDHADQIAATCARSGFKLEDTNRALIELLATAREPADQTFAVHRTSARQA